GRGRRICGRRVLRRLPRSVATFAARPPAAGHGRHRLRAGATASRRAHVVGRDGHARRGRGGRRRAAAAVQASDRRARRRLRRAGAAFAGVEFYAAYLDPSRPSLLDHLPQDTVVIDFEPARQRADARTLLDETAMLAAAEAGGGELPRQFKLPTVERADDFGVRPHLTITSAEGTGDAIDLGWFEGEPLVGQPRALAGFAARAEGSAIVFATEQDERLRALLDESGVT